MLNNQTIAVVIPAYNEEQQIGVVLNTMPYFVDRIVIVNDKSKDRTSEVVEKFIFDDPADYTHSQIGKRVIEKNFFNEAEMVLQQKNEEEIAYFTPAQVMNKKPEADRIILINHLKNGGVGAAIATGYKWAKDNNIDCTAVMAGDGQMDPSELEAICMPVIDEGIDYVKGNRLLHRSAKYTIPRTRFMGNSILSILTKLASGYWKVSDTQTGYTAISKNALNLIDLHKIYKRYGMPNDTLVKLNIANCTLREVVIKPVYRIGEQSKMKIAKVIPKVSFLLVRLFFQRIWRKYFVKGFHPLFLLYVVGLVLIALALPYGVKIARLAINLQDANPVTVIAFAFLSFFGFQSILFAMWMDIQDNDKLYK